MPLVSVLARNIATALQRLRQNHRRRQEVGLLCGLYSVIVLYMQNKSISIYANTSTN
jgi:hypothetical protein